MLYSTLHIHNFNLAFQLLYQPAQNNTVNYFRLYVESPKLRLTKTHSPVHKCINEDVAGGKTMRGSSQAQHLCLVSLDSQW